MLLLVYQYKSINFVSQNISSTVETIIYLIKKKKITNYKISLYLTFIKSVCYSVCIKSGLTRSFTHINFNLNCIQVYKLISIKVKFIFF